MKNLILFLFALCSFSLQANDLVDFMGKWSAKTSESGLNAVEIKPFEQSSSSALVKFKARSSNQVPYTFEKKATVVFNADGKRYLYIRYAKNEIRTEYRLQLNNGFLNVGKLVRQADGSIYKSTYKMTKEVLLNPQVIQSATFNTNSSPKGRISGKINGPLSEAKKVTMVLTHIKSGQIYFGDVSKNKTYSIDRLPSGNFTLEVFGGDLDYTPNFLKKNLYLSDRSGWNKEVNVNLSAPSRTNGRQSKPKLSSICISYSAYGDDILGPMKLSLINQAAERVYTVDNVGKTYRFENIVAGTYEVHGNCGKCELIRDPLGGGRKVSVRHGETLVLDLSGKKPN
ncbi:MAG: hypothetical protein AAF598_06010 [Bacteroidota bacterium]